MASRDLSRIVFPAVTLPIKARTANDSAATAVDLQGYEGAGILFIAGTITDGTHGFIVEEATDSGFTQNVVALSVDNATLFGNVPQSWAAANTNAAAVLAWYVGSKRYLRVRSASNGATTGGIFGAIVLRGFPRHALT